MAYIKPPFWPAQAFSTRVTTSVRGPDTPRPPPARGPCPQRFAKPVANSVGVCFSGAWGQNETSIEREVLEYCLHHIEGGEAELAYARGDVWEKRKAALKEWETVCNSKAAPKLKLVA